MDEHTASLRFGSRRFHDRSSTELALGHGYRATLTFFFFLFTTSDILSTCTGGDCCICMANTGTGYRERPKYWHGCSDGSSVGRLLLVCFKLDVNFMGEYY